MSAGFAPKAPPNSGLAVAVSAPAAGVVFDWPNRPVPGVFVVFVEPKILGVAGAGDVAGADGVVLPKILVVAGVVEVLFPNKPPDAGAAPPALLPKSPPVPPDGAPAAGAPNIPPPLVDVPESNDQQ